MRSLVVVVALAGCAALAGCSSTTSGAGRVGGPSARVTHEFPSASAPATTPAAATSAAPASTPAPSIHPAPSSPLRTVTVHAPDGTTYVVKIWQQVDNSTCFDHAYGTPMISFLTQHPCAGLRRILATTTVGGRPVGFAQSSTGFRGTPANPYKYAEEFKALEEADNTGSINDLMREGYRLPTGPTSVPSSEAFNVLGQDNGVVVYDAWYLDGSTQAQDPALIKMTQDIFLQF